MVSHSIESGRATKNNVEPKESNVSQTEHTIFNKEPISCVGSPSKCAKKRHDDKPKKPARKGPKARLPTMLSSDMGNPQAHKKGRDTTVSIMFIWKKLMNHLLH